MRSANAPDLLFDQIRGQLERLIPLFGFSRPVPLVWRSFDILCGQSLRISPSRRAPEFSRINADGTPFQCSLQFCRARSAPLQFLSEAGRPGCGMQERLDSSRVAMRDLAELLGIQAELERVSPLLERMAPLHGRGLLANDAGIFWFAPSFPPEDSPALTIYVNARWGTELSQWRRMDSLAAWFDSAEHWNRLLSLAGWRFSPLGMALTLQREKAATGRLYVSAYGVEWSFYRALMRACSPGAGSTDACDAFAADILSGDVCYPTRSAVFSLELAAGCSPGAKLELCAHCAFEHDAQAARRISRWLEHLGCGSALYYSTLCGLTGERPLSKASPPAVHAYAGFGMRPSGPYACIYLNPGAALELT
jgi:hypothetical protein